MTTATTGQAVHFSIKRIVGGRDLGELYLTDVHDTNTDGQKGCNFSFTDRIGDASQMPPKIAAKRLPRIWRSMGHDRVTVRNEFGNPVRLCLECDGVYAEADMLPNSDLCRECAQDISERVEATMGGDW